MPFMGFLGKLSLNVDMGLCKIVDGGGNFSVNWVLFEYLDVC